MTHDNHTWSASELIYLFVDGEANDVQRSTLFAALANDADLQTEFSDVLRIRTAAESERGYAVPPAQTTAGLFERAGFAAPVSLPGSVGGAAVGGAAAGGSGLLGWPLIRKFGTPLLSALVGAVITFFLLPNGTGIQQGNDAVVAELSTPPGDVSTITPPHADDLERRGTPSESIARRQFASERAAASDGNAPNSALEGFSPAADHQLDAGTSNEGHDMNRMPVTSLGVANSNGSNGTPEESLPEASIADNAEMPAPTTLAADETDRNASLRARISIALDNGEPMPAIDPEKERESAPSGDDVEARSPNRAPDEPEPMTFTTQPSRFSIQLRGIMPVEMFPFRNDVAGTGALEDIAIAAFYNPSEDHSIGIEVGRERHPLYVIGDPILQTKKNPGPIITINSTGPSGGGGPAINFNEANTVPTTSTMIPNGARYTAVTESTPTYRLEPYSSWLGLTYRYRMDRLTPSLPIFPYAQALLGASNFGPLGKGGLGLSWKPDSRVTFGIGFEGTAIMYREDGGWHSSRKLGATYSAQVEF